MKIDKSPQCVLLIIFIFGLSCSSCGLFPQAETNLLQSPTHTPTGGGYVQPQASPTPKHPCDSLAGTLELQILVGPSEAVGLEPVSVGYIPFNVRDEDGIFSVQGGGPLEVYGEVLELEKGTYTVTFEGDTAVTGECFLSEHVGFLNLNVEFTGEQLVEVEAEGFQGAYPWSGTNTMTVELPIVEGASQGGEGWILTLHLN